MPHAPLTSVRSALHGPHRAHPPDLRVRLRKAAGFVLSLLVLAGLAVFVVPQVADLQGSWELLHEGRPSVLFMALVLEAGSFLAYFALFRSVFRPGHPSIGWRESCAIPLASLAANRVVPGAGGLALTVWAVERLGVSLKETAERTVAYVVMLDGTYLGALVIAAASLGLFAGATAPPALTWIPAVVGLAAIGAALLFLLDRPEPTDGEVAGHDGRSSRGRRVLARLRAVPDTIARGERSAFRLVREGSAGPVWAVLWWGLDAATLWTALAAFGAPPDAAVVAVAYFVGQAAGALPLPGGFGGVEAGMIAVLVLLGVAGDLALVGVLAYRVLAYWLPTLPGVAALVGVRRAATAT